MKVSSDIDTFEIGRIVATGDQYTVFEAIGEFTTKPAFIKKMSREYGFKINPMERTKSIKCENIVQCIDTAQDDNAFYAIYNIPVGINLAEMLKSQGKLTEQQTSGIIKQVLTAACYCHSQGYGLLNLCLSNVYMDKNDFIEILDFSFNCQYNKDEFINEYPHSLYTAPPEFFSRQKFLVQLADSWSIGILTYNLISGHYPWPNIRQVEEVPGSVIKPPPILLHNSTPCTNFIQKMMMVDDACRFSITQALNHVWITHGRCSIPRLNVKSDQNLNERIAASRIAKIDFGKSSVCKRSTSLTNQKLLKVRPTNSFSKTDLVLL
ncbi:CAMK family protein kinase [Trichomonas vaginalis G3]|uniref:CAMK family protein kinase n=1 Tax=Trichomonas vaginalis (strain ATCC PRA-98 / G3) TaxID=412133 RepID=A2FLH5_TRIV3|nr:protein serine/threonine kinase protein [Trichomonas vaginalis G3]EAX94258.1 CAMK family protein kinase [Trichomonas vaginalis G3]KAI5484192.1 protein serine/threonine kinase protein [Trichomonas vaginalis G3]|eukprot:XP_001307188.1 CAMK family protein kinase [Trichomonas vaginalis G3]